MRVLLVTGSYPPDKCGVGDYTYYLANALAAEPHIEVGVLTGVDKTTDTSSNLISLYRVVSGWGLWHAFQVKRIVSSFQPDVVHIQYPTQGYKRGLLANVAPILVRLMKVPVVQTWHEPFYLLDWPHLLACNAVIYVRPCLPKRLPMWVRLWLGHTPLVYVPNAATIPVVTLTGEQARTIKQGLSGGMPIVCFFGFALPSKGIELLFDIATPSRHHLVLVCDLAIADVYQASILRLVNQAPWVGNVTVTGFQSAHRVGEILAVADAAVFPFLSGTGEWNTSLRAAQNSGVFTLATSRDARVLGYNEQSNTYLTGCNQVTSMREALDRYLGWRRPRLAGNEWKSIALEHKKVYRDVLGRNSPAGKQGIA